MSAMLGVSVQGESLALPAADVLEIVRVPQCTRVPNAPPSLVGVANLRGSLLPVVSVASLLGHPETAGRGPSARVVVMAGPVGLLVDAVSSLSQTAEGRLLAPAALLTPAFGGLLRRTGARPDARTYAAPAAVAAGHAATPLIAFRLAAQEYALPLEAVAEVLRVPAMALSSLAEVPRTDDAMLGVTAFRGGLLPVVSLRTLLGLPPAPLNPKARLVVTALDGRPLGLLVDQVSGTIAVPAGAIDPVPPVLLRGAGEAQLEGICRLEDGRRLVALLSPTRLFDPATAARLQTQHESASLPAPQQAAAEAMEQFVVFRLGEEQYGLPIATVDEVVRRPDTLTRLPHAPDFVEGVMNLHGRAIPVIDASSRFGVAGRPRAGRVVVVTVDGVQAGLAVDAVSEVMGVASSTLRTAPAFEDGRAPLFDRIAIERDGQMILLISAEALLAQAEIDLRTSFETTRHCEERSGAAVQGGNRGPSPPGSPRRQEAARDDESSS